MFQKPSPGADGVCLFRPGGCSKSDRAERKGREADERRRASLGCFAPRSRQVEQKLPRLISAARTRPARQPGSNLQHGQSRGAGISADSNLKRAVRAWPSRCLVPAARRGRFRPHLPAGPEITSEGERPLHCPKPTAREALRKCRAAGAGECTDAERSRVLRPGC